MKTTKWFKQKDQFFKKKLWSDLLRFVGWQHKEMEGEPSRRYCRLNRFYATKSNSVALEQSNIREQIQNKWNKKTEGPKTKAKSKKQKDKKCRRHWHEHNQKPWANSPEAGEQENHGPQADGLRAGQEAGSKGGTPLGAELGSAAAQGLRTAAVVWWCGPAESLWCLPAESPWRLQAKKGRQQDPYLLFGSFWAGDSCIFVHRQVNWYGPTRRSPWSLRRWSWIAGILDFARDLVLLWGVS